MRTRVHARTHARARLRPREIQRGGVYRLILKLFYCFDNQTISALDPTECQRKQGKKFSNTKHALKRTKMPL